MIYFLTSSHCVEGAPVLNPANGFEDMLRDALAGVIHRNLNLMLNIGSFGDTYTVYTALI